MDTEQLDRLSALLARRTGLNTFERGRARLIEMLHYHPEASRDLKAYIVHLEMLSESHPVWQSLLSELTVGETYFMRDTAQIEVLRHHILPTVIDHKRQAGDYALQVWSAGCATGEEAYTLAILLHELIPDRYRWDIQVLGTDINDAALEIAQSGRYRDWSFRNTPPDVRSRYFTLMPHTSPTIYEVHPAIRELVRFQHHNLVTDALGLHEVVVCRNVMLYFTRPQSEIAEQQLAKSLNTWGWLLLGSAETLLYVRHQFLARHFDEALAFQKLGAEQKALPPNHHTTTITSPVADVVAHNPAAEKNYRRAVRALQRGNPQQALAFLKSIEYQPAAVHSLMASALISLGDKTSAYQHLMQALEADRLYPDAHYLMALLHMEAEDLVAARTSIRAAIYCRPDFALAHLLSGDLFMQESDPERAIRAWTTARRIAAELSPDMPLSDVAEIVAGQVVTLVDSRLGK